MSIAEDKDNIHRPPGWALDRAANDLFQVTDPAIIEEHAWELVRAAEVLEEERHDEYDDPDQGGEA